MTITQVGIPQPGIDALSLVAPRVDPFTGQAFASELATSTHALQTAAPGRDSSLRSLDTTARVQRDSSDAADDRPAASDRADRSSAPDKTNRADAADRADRADAADKADRADAADKADRADAAADGEAASTKAASAKTRADRATKSDRSSANTDDAAQEGAAPLAVANVAVAQILVAEQTTDVVDAGAALSAPTVSAPSAASATLASAGPTLPESIDATIVGANVESASLAPTDAQTALSSIEVATQSGVAELEAANAKADIKADAANTKVNAKADIKAEAITSPDVAAIVTTDAVTASVDASRVKVDGKAEAVNSTVDATSANLKVDGKAEAVNSTVDATSANLKVDAATTNSDQSFSATIDAATQSVTPGNQTATSPIVASLVQDSGSESAPTSISTSSSINAAVPTATTMPSVSDTGRSAAAAPPTPVATQLVAHMTNFRGRADGSYETTLTLHPADLGQVSIRIEVLNGTVAIHAMGAHAATVEALRAAMPQLQQELADAGLNLIGSQVSQQSEQGQQSAERTPAQESAPQIGSTLNTGGRSGDVDVSVSTGLLGRDGRVDVRV